MRASWLVGLLVVAAVSPLANAYITGITCAADGDGAVTCASGWAGTNPDTLGHSTEATLNLTEKMLRQPAHVGGNVATSDDLDPTVWILKTVENATPDTWTGYHFNIFMDKAFSIPTGAAPDYWTFVITPATPGTYFDTDGRPWGFWGAVDFTSTGPAHDIAPGGSGDFGAKVSFLGGVQFEVEQMYVVPEPVSMALLALGGLFLRRRK
jgi:hypothetical protein